MHCSTVVRASFLVALACCAPASPARAGFDLTTTFSGPDELPQIASVSGESVIAFGERTHNTLECDQGGTVVPLITGTASTTSNDPDPFDGLFTLTVRISDYDNATPGVLTFSGVVTGAFSNRRSTLDERPTGAHVKSVKIGSKTYSVALLGFVPPAPPVTTGEAIFFAEVTCAPTATAVASVSLEHASVSVGGAVKGAVTLNGPAPRGGARVDVRSSHMASVAIPSPVFVPEGETIALFAGAALAADTNVEVEAHWNGSVQSTEVTVAAKTCGDFDGDHAVDLQDVTRLLRAVAGLEPLPDC